MFELCPYTSLYNEPSPWSVFGFLPPNWAWWAWHLIVRPLWESHYLNTLQWQLQSKILWNNLVKCHASLSHVAQKTSQGLMCPTLSEQATFLHHYGVLIILHRLYFTRSQNDHSHYPSPPTQLTVTFRTMLLWNRSKWLPSQVLTGGGFNHWDLMLIKKGKIEEESKRQIMSDVICTPTLNSLTLHSQGIPFYL